MSDNAKLLLGLLVFLLILGFVVGPMEYDVEVGHQHTATSQP